MLDPIDVAYDVIEGVSVGSINAGVLASFEKGDERNAVEFLEATWLTLPVKEFWTHWPYLGPFELLWRNSLLDN